MKINNHLKNIKNIVFLFFFLGFIFSGWFNFAQAANSDLIITEIMYNPEGVDDKHEWVEFYNRGSESVVIVGGGGADSWRFYDGKNHYLNSDNAAIGPGQYFILADDASTFIGERPNFNGLVIDTIMELKNSGGDNIKLINSEKREIVNIVYQNSWGGDGDGKSLEKINVNGSDEAENWRESIIAGGTPGAENSVSGEQISPAESLPGQKTEPKITPPPENSQTEPQPQHEPKKTEKKLSTTPSESNFVSDKTYPSGIVINELLPSPEGPDSEEEWIEIYNQNPFEIELSGWKIKDTQGSVMIYTFPQGTKISGYGFLVLPRTLSKITLNNDGDGLNLIQPDGKILDVITYQKAPKGQSYNRTDSGWAWNSTLTPGSLNIISSAGSGANQTKPLNKENSSVSPVSQSTSSLAISNQAVGEGRVTELAADVSSAFRSFGTHRASYTFLIAFILAVFSAIVILLLKKKVNSHSEQE